MFLLLLYKASLQIDPNNLETYLYMGRCYLAMNHYGLAQEQVEKLRTAVDSSFELNTNWAFHIEKLDKEIAKKLKYRGI